MEPWRKPADVRKLTAAIAALVAVGGCGDESAENDGAPSTGAGESNTSAGKPVNLKAGGVGEVESAYVGRVRGNENIYVSVATLRSDGRDYAMTYLCDGKKVAELLYGPLRGEGKSTVVSRKGGNVALTRAGGKYLGDGVRADGTRVSFVVSEVETGDRAGLYLVAGGGKGTPRGLEYAGWIVLPDGSQRGAIRQDGAVLSGATLNTRTGTVAVDSRTLRPSVAVMAISKPAPGP